MKNVVVKILGIADLTDFVRYATQMESDVIVRKGHWTVDGKSLLGMFSIDPTTGVTVEYNPADDTTGIFTEFLKKFEV